MVVIAIFRACLYPNDIRTSQNRDMPRSFTDNGHSRCILHFVQSTQICDLFREKLSKCAETTIEV